jgi:predicted O-methyltransferase YrrM
MTAHGPGARLRRAIRYLRSPRWGVAYWRSRRGSARVAYEQEPQHFDRAAVRDRPAVALAAVTGFDQAACDAALAAAELPDSIPGDAMPWWPRGLLMRVAAALTALVEPRAAIEIGVARGYTSAAVLSALAQAGGGGRLFSIDLPALDEPADFVGRAVSEQLRGRWELRLGPSAAELPRLLADLGREDVGLFIHDGDHSYRSQLQDLETVWPRLRPGAVALVDDLWTAALFDFAEQAGAEVAIARGDLVGDAVGLIAKPSRA